MLLLICKPFLYFYILLTSNNLYYQSFQTSFYIYNYAFVFIFISYKKDIYINFLTRIQCFQIYSQLFYYYSLLQLMLYKVLSFAQLFFYNLAYIANVKANQYLQLDQTIFSSLTKMLIDYNPFICLYQTTYKCLVTQ